MTISLRESREDLDAVEAASVQVREQAARSLSAAALPVNVCQVEIAGQVP